MIHRAACWIVCLALLSSVAVHGADSWVGKQVMQKREHIDFGDRIDGKQVYFELRSAIAPVVKDQDGWLRIRDYDDREGWVDKNDFVPLPDAPAYFTQVIRMNTRETWGWIQRGTAWRGLGQLDRAVNDYNRSLRINPGSSATFFFRGVVWQIEKDFNRAISDFTQAIWLKPQSDFAFIARGKIWQSLKEYEKALNDFDEAIRLDPKSPIGYRNKAYLLAVSSNDRIRGVAKAQELMKIAVELRKGSPSNDATLGVIAAALGNFDDAVRFQRKALEDPVYAGSEGVAARERLKAYEQKKPVRE